MYVKYRHKREWEIENITNILKENLKDLDQLREDILSMGNNRFELTRNSKLGGNIDFNYIKHILGGNNSKYENSTIYNRNSAQCGLLLKTYQSDIFTNWINSDWIDGENGISAITAISTEGDKFTIDQLNLSKKVYDNFYCTSENSVGKGLFHFCPSLGPKRPDCYCAVFRYC